MKEGERRKEGEGKKESGLRATPFWRVDGGEPCRNRRCARVLFGDEGAEEVFEGF